jgi:hypothetical protein
LICDLECGVLLCDGRLCFCWTFACAWKMRVVLHIRVSTVFRSICQNSTSSADVFAYERRFVISVSGDRSKSRRVTSRQSANRSAKSLMGQVQSFVIPVRFRCAANSCVSKLSAAASLTSFAFAEQQQRGSEVRKG